MDDAWSGLGHFVRGVSIFGKKIIAYFILDLSLMLFFEGFG